MFRRDEKSKDSTDVTSLWNFEPIGRRKREEGNDDYTNQG